MTREESGSAPKPGVFRVAVMRENSEKALMMPQDASLAAPRLSQPGEK
jgi:hypothetical protein